MEERPEVALAEVLVKSIVEVGGEEDGGAAEAVDEGLRDLFLLGGGHVGAEGADEEHLHLVGDAVAEAEEERVVVPGEDPAAAVRAAARDDGELVGDDDEALADGGGGHIGGDAAGGGPLVVLVVQLRQRAGHRHDPRHPPRPERPRPAPPAAGRAERREVPRRQVEQVGVGPRHHG